MSCNTSISPSPVIKDIDFNFLTDSTLSDTSFYTGTLTVPPDSAIVTNIVSVNDSIIFISSSLLNINKE